MNYNIALLKGDGIGPEIVDSAVAVLQKIGEKFHHTFTCTPYLIGGCAIDATGVPLPKETVDGCLASDSVLLGARLVVQLVIPSGMPCRRICVRKRLCSAFGRLWDCLPTCVRRNSILL